jgi:hypothetical protein
VSARDAEAGRPAFAAAFPDDPALNALLASFERGDFGRVRSDAAKVIREAPSSEVRAAAEEILARTRPDPLSKVFFLLAAGLLLFLSAYWWWRAGGRG